MKFLPLAALCLFSVSVFTISCSKDSTSTPDQIDSLKSILPKQIIYEVPGAGQGAGINVVSIKYDTLNRNIQLYEDDTTNANPYDVLLATYRFNQDGYLLQFESTDHSLANMDYQNTIIDFHREANNNISYITYRDKSKAVEYTTTTAYTYKTESGGTVITTEGSNAYFFGACDYHYDANFNLISYQASYYTDYANGILSYNANNSINKISGLGVGENLTEFSYTSGMPDQKEDLLERVLLGKDYYLWDLKLLNPFVFDLDMDYDNFLLSATNPFHVTSMKDTHQPDASPTGIETATFTYELNKEQLLWKVTQKIDGELAAVVTFKY